jgi:hypothetical protein
MPTVQPMTIEEKQRILEILEVDPNYAPNLGVGGSIFDDSGRWLGGAVYRTVDGDEVVGGFIPEIQGTGLWIYAWGDLTDLLFAEHDPFFMVSDSPRTYNLLRKLGCYHFKQNNAHSYRVMFNKFSVDTFLSKFNKIPETQPEAIVDDSIDPLPHKLTVTIEQEDGSTTTYLTGL